MHTGAANGGRGGRTKAKEREEGCALGTRVTPFLDDPLVFANCLGDVSPSPSPLTLPPRLTTSWGKADSAGRQLRCKNAQAAVRHDWKYDAFELSPEIPRPFPDGIG